MEIHGVITTLEEFDTQIEGIRFRRAETQALGLPYRSEFYRGQLDSSWSIIPGISRDLKTAHQVAQAEQKILDHFKSQVTTKDYLNKIFLHANPNNYQNEWAWLMQAQHYRIPTRMLDWSLKPEVSLYFAVDNSQMDHADGQFLVMYYPLFEIKVEGGQHPPFYATHPSALTETWMMNPAFYAENDPDQTTAETRRARQFGKFSIQPYELSLTGLDEQACFCRNYYETFEPVIEKYIIPAAFKPQLRLDMIARGWHGDFLYKDEDPIINAIKDECRDILADHVKAANA